MNNPLDHTPNAIGIFIAVKKKGSNIILVEGDQEKETFEFVLQVVMPQKNLKNIHKIRIYFNWQCINTLLTLICLELTEKR
jgi:hypothetical protein